MKEKNNEHQYIKKFYPDISVLNTDCRDFLFSFDAGIGNENFNDFLQNEADSVLGFKALFLHSVPQAETFYLKNGFRDMKINMQPFASVDSDMRPMWLPLKNVHMNYEK